jgi:lipopolysaccharide biosynthesis glycosyltransferase
MNCIFICIFNDENYINMLYLCLESIFIFGNLDKNTEILIYTSTKIMNIIKQSHLFNDEKIKFEINDTYNTVEKACKARLDLFNLSHINNYEKILYLDTDIIIKNNINTVFDICKENYLYTVEEGDIKDDSDYWGKSLFGEEIYNYIDTSAFSSGILLFKNCEEIKQLFKKINEDMTARYHFFCDQPFFIYNAFKYNLYNNKLLKTYAVNNNCNMIFNNIIIHHFPGCPGEYKYKIDIMTVFLNSLKDIIIENCIKNTKNIINNYLMPIINNCGELLEGNIFTLHHTTEYSDIFINKVKNISNVLLNKNIKNVMEIGFNSGFSALLMLVTNPNIKITCYDLGEHKYTIPCYEILKQLFQDRINIIIGDSTKTLYNDINKYDLIHIDGGHTTEIVTNDIKNSYCLSKKGTILIMNDYDFDNIHILWNYYKNEYNLKSLNIHINATKYHDIKYVLNNN